MSTPPNKSNSRGLWIAGLTCAGCGLVVLIFVIGGSILALSRRHQEARRELEAARAQAEHERARAMEAEEAARPPKLSAIDTTLRGQAFEPAPDKSSIIAAVLVDTSGSMKEQVRDADGIKRPKLEIARRCVVQLFTQAEQFAREHREQDVELALYEFSVRDNQPRCRIVLPAASPSASRASAAVAELRPEGDTPIGDALVFARGELARSGLFHQHLLVVTDGANTKGLDPSDVVAALERLPQEQRPATYLIAFDVDAKVFGALGSLGALVLPAAGGSELQTALDYLLTGKILAEQPLAPGELKSDGELR